MCPLDFYLAELVKRKIIARDTALERCHAQDDLKRFINNPGSSNSPLFGDLEYT